MGESKPKDKMAIHHVVLCTCSTVQSDNLAEGRVPPSCRHVQRHLSIDLKGIPGAKEALSVQKGMLADGDLEATTGQVKKESVCVCVLERERESVRVCVLER